MVKLKEITQYPSSFHQPQKDLEVGDIVRYLLRDGEGFDGPSQQRATDPIWSTDLFTVKKIINFEKPSYYYLEEKSGQFLREQLQGVES